MAAGLVGQESAREVCGIAISSTSELWYTTLPALDHCRWYRQVYTVIEKQWGHHNSEFIFITTMIMKCFLKIAKMSWMWSKNLETLNVGNHQEQQKLIPKAYCTIKLSWNINIILNNKFSHIGCRNCCWYD
jgi:hypothetical protein